MRAFPKANPIRGVAMLFAASLVALAACATPAPTHHLRVVNATYDDVMSLATAPSGSTDFHDVAMTRPLAGGLNSLVVDVSTEPCHRDVRVTFRDGRSLLYPNLDVCRHDGLRLATGAQASRATPLSDNIEAAGSP